MTTTTIICESIEAAKQLSRKFAGLLEKNGQLKVYSNTRLAVVTVDGDTYRFITGHLCTRITQGLDPKTIKSGKVFEEIYMKKYEEDNEDVIS